ncbi:DNA-directed RNA polymerases I and III subunit RPAC1, variant 2 [Dermatophagoides farinae]|uniref:DNA-directed RNA polymerases I and III subunit RPAC1, variant 2 n=1 Tax=Dermatophagoides farinae TaxID=6954 RepID=A0A922IEP9_DERFA|nr:DNA-directed RNA polymerases I and III subunit RPAC1, variant 2 [Dermatophagoides farinae]
MFPALSSPIAAVRPQSSNATPKPNGTWSFGKIDDRPVIMFMSCANWTNIDWKYVDECASGNRGKQLLVEAGRKTKAIKPKISFVPTIIFNEKYSDRIQNQALYGDFVKLIENHYNKNNEHKSE